MPLIALLPLFLLLKLFVLALEFTFHELGVNVRMDVVELNVLPVSLWRARCGWTAVACVGVGRYDWAHSGGCR